VLCDTNGGVMPEEARTIVAEIARIAPGTKLGIHTHNDTEQAIAVGLAAIDAGVRQIQGTLNGLGERCGNMNLVSLIPTLVLKEPYASAYETGVSKEKLPELTRISRLIDTILNRAPNRHAPYVGVSAFAHKAGLHASAVAKDPTTYEHVPPETVGNERIIPISNQAGRSNLIKRLSESGIYLEKDDPRGAELLTLVKEREDQGYAYDEAEASFTLLAHRHLGTAPSYFHVDRYRVIVERRFNANNQLVTVSEAVVAVEVDGVRKISVAENLDTGAGTEDGPVDALYTALTMDLGRYQSHMNDLRLVDYKVRILTTGTEAVTRVLIESADSRGRWTTVGVSSNIMDASFQALNDAVITKLMRDGAKP
jgi:2-isopropylmalate synthase